MTKKNDDMNSCKNRNYTIEFLIYISTHDWLIAAQYLKGDTKQATEQQEYQLDLIMCQWFCLFTNLLTVFVIFQSYLSFVVW